MQAQQQKTEQEVRDETVAKCKNFCQKIAKNSQNGQKFYVLEQNR